MPFLGILSNRIWSLVTFDNKELGTYRSDASFGSGTLTLVSVYRTQLHYQVSYKPGISSMRFWLLLDNVCALRTSYDIRNKHLSSHK
jgi:hypothetical protein